MAEGWQQLVDEGKNFFEDEFGEEATDKWLLFMGKLHDHAARRRIVDQATQYVSESVHQDDFDGFLSYFSVPQEMIDDFDMFRGVLDSWGEQQ